MDNSRMYIIIIAFFLAAMTTTVIKNTVQYDVLSDADRYAQEISHGSDRVALNLLFPLVGNDFVTKTNFLFIGIIGWLVYSSTKNWRITFLALLGFSVSLMLYFSLLAQAIVVIIGLFLWTKINPFGEHKIRDHILFILLALVMLYTHKFGGFLAILIYLAKFLNVEKIYYYFHKFIPIQTAAIFMYFAVGATALLVFFSSPERVSFFYYFILPISLGPFDIVFWYGLFGVILWMFLSCKDNSKEAFIVVACLLATVINYHFFSHLEIDFWRILIFPELVMLIKIGQSEENKIIKWVPWFLIAMGVERLILGILH